jgi:hypothetical protein
MNMVIIASVSGGAGDNPESIFNMVVSMGESALRERTSGDSVSLSAADIMELFGSFPGVQPCHVDEKSEVWTQGGTETCSICLEELPTSKFVRLEPCKHHAACSACFERSQSVRYVNNLSWADKCPICRQAIKQVVKYNS